MSNFTDSRDSEKSNFGDNLPKSVNSIWQTSNDVRDDILIELKQREETGKMP